MKEKNLTAIQSVAAVQNGSRTRRTKKKELAET
jgi:hypothetical protein